MTPEDFRVAFGVSRETLARLQAFVALLSRWNRRINLVAPGTLDELWSRHMADSAQLFDLAPPHAKSWIDLGSGGGFPGLVVGVMAAELRPELRVRLVESDERKAVFLSEAVRETGIAAAVEARRIEALAAEPHDVVSARALAPLDRLCGLAQNFVGPESLLLIPKGAGLESELTAATARWHICAERVVSRTEPAATILVIRELRPRT